MKARTRNGASAADPALVADLARAYAAEAGRATMTLRRAAAVVGLGVRTLRRAVQSGALRVSRVGPRRGAVLVTALRLAEWVAAGERPTRARYNGNGAPR